MNFLALWQNDEPVVYLFGVTAKPGTYEADLACVLKALPVGAKLDNDGEVVTIIEAVTDDEAFEPLLSVTLGRDGTRSANQEEDT